MRLFLVIGVALLAGACVNGSGGEQDMVTVWGRIIYLHCNATPQPTCRAARLPADVGGATQDAPVHIVGKPGGGGFGVDGRNGTFDGMVAAGTYTAKVPLLELPDCSPRPRFAINVGHRYRILFRFATPGHCSATVWEQPDDPQSTQPDRVVARVAG